MVEIDNDAHRELFEGLQKFESKPMLKLSKMSKGFNWEIKLLEIDVDEIERINNDMIARFGSLEI